VVLVLKQLKNEIFKLKDGQGQQYSASTLNLLGNASAKASVN